LASPLLASASRAEVARTPGSLSALALGDDFSESMVRDVAVEENIETEVECDLRCGAVRREE
jgi:formate dehydrogenase assembly factor FdhD